MPNQFTQPTHPLTPTHSSVLTLGAAILLVALGCAAAAVWGGGRKGYTVDNNKDTANPSTMLRGTGPALNLAKKGGCGCGGGKDKKAILELAADAAGRCGCGGGCGCAPCHPGCACGGGGDAKTGVLLAEDGEGGAALAREGCGKGCDCSGGCGGCGGKAKEAAAAELVDVDDDGDDDVDAVDDPLEAAASPLGPGGLQLAKEKKKKGKGKGKGKGKAKPAADDSTSSGSSSGGGATSGGQAPFDWRLVACDCVILNETHPMLDISSPKPYRTTASTSPAAPVRAGPPPPPPRPPRPAAARPSTGASTFHP